MDKMGMSHGSTACLWAIDSEPNHLTLDADDPSHPSQPRDSLSSVSTTSLVFDRIDEREKLARHERIQDFEDEDPLKDDEQDAFLVVGLCKPVVAMAWTGN